MTDEATPQDSQTTNDAPPAGQSAAADEGTIVGGAEVTQADDAGETSTEVKEGGDQSTEAEEGEKDEGDKEDAAAVLGAPEAYDFKGADLGEGVTFDKEAFDAVEPVLRELDLSQDAAGKLVAAYAGKVMPLIEQRLATQAAEAGAAMRTDWARETAADKELGGAHLDESKAMVAKAMSKFLPQGEEGQKFRTFMNESGLGNHPEMVRFMARVGRALGEASADSTTNHQPTASREDRWYGNRSK